MIFRVTYDDGTEFQGRCLPECEWKNIHDRPIKILDFRVANFVYSFMGFKEYNIKAEKMGFGVNGISKLFVFARGKDESVVISCYRNIKNQLEVNKNITAVGEEYGKIIVVDWREGVFDQPAIHRKDLDRNVFRNIY